MYGACLEFSGNTPQCGAVVYDSWLMASTEELATLDRYHHFHGHSGMRA
jgi:hypothetical protein